ncbi:MAG: hypothetical protein EOP54_21445 [Sphingobacteriales bacterium]|nr:MAG: hypothetical protein EOP54_21445 [Sphingobacteriales bacterium]
MRLIVSLLATILFVCSCNENGNRHRTVQPAFYYWKSNFSLSAFENQKIDSLQIKKLYVKFFDIGWSMFSHQPMPIAQLRVADKKSLRRFDVIPTVFITNECIYNLREEQVQLLAGEIVLLLNGMFAVNDIRPVREVQIDCDWTAQTRERYFKLLVAIKSMLNGPKLSATIRLHQVKYVDKTGIPPVDRGMLMCYNMGNLTNRATRNSIIEVEEMKKYTAGLNSYPLALDVAFPMFEWCVLFRNNNFKGLIENFDVAQLQASFSTKDKNIFTLQKDTLLAGYQFKKGDLLRYEASNIETVQDAAKEISRELKTDTLRVSLYHLDSITLKKYSVYEMETIFNGMR